MKRTHIFHGLGPIALLAGVVAFVGCDSEGGGDSTSGGGDGGGDSAGQGVNRGGPESLRGFEWESEPQTANGIELVAGFSFDDASVTLRSTCDDTLTAVVSAPVRYSYSVQVSAGNSDEATEGDASCFVEVVAGGFDFEVIDGVLVATSGGQSFEFESVGAVAGLYGEWTTEADFGSLTWSMGNGTIRATADCNNGLSASTEVSAEFTNRLEILEAAEATETDGTGFECTAAIERANATYRFDGDALLLDVRGETLRLEPNE